MGILTTWQRSWPLALVPGPLPAKAWHGRNCENDEIISTVKRMLRRKRLTATARRKQKKQRVFLLPLDLEGIVSSKIFWILFMDWIIWTCTSTPIHVSRWVKLKLVQRFRLNHSSPWSHMRVSGLQKGQHVGTSNDLSGRNRWAVRLHQPGRNWQDEFQAIATRVILYPK